jgi:signal transduction histidine kinase
MPDIDSPPEWRRVSTSEPEKTKSMGPAVSAIAAGQLRPLRRLRLRLTAWYVGTFALILLILGGTLFAVIAHQMRRELDDSLRAATRAVEQATQIREVEAVSAPGTAMDAVAELTIPGRSLYLFDSAGKLLVPHEADRPVSEAAARAARAGDLVDSHYHAPGDRALQLHAEPFRVSASGHRYVAIAVADRVELEDRYAALIATFAGAAVVALLLVAAGGWFLAGKSAEPVERTLAHMRRFMADAAHELRTPVAVLRGRAEVALQRERDPAGYGEALAAVGAEAERIGRIVDDLLMLARADAGERPVVRERVYLDDVALDAVDSARALAEHRGVEINVREFEEAGLDADPVLLRQLVLILLDNAVKFTPPGGRVTLDVRAEGGRGVLAVEDTGVGISTDDLPRVFDRFYRGASGRAQADGAGLGLSIARWIADAHSARIDVTSMPGAGTRVTVRFPPPPGAG